MTAEGAPEARPIARIALRKEPAAARGRAPVFHVFAEIYARYRSEAPSPAPDAGANGACS